jgi:hypothetical protein
MDAYCWNLCGRQCSCTPQNFRPNSGEPEGQWFAEVVQVAAETGVALDLGSLQVGVDGTETALGLDNPQAQADDMERVQNGLVEGLEGDRRNSC